MGRCGQTSCPHPCGVGALGGEDIGEMLHQRGIHAKHCACLGFGDLHRSHHFYDVIGADLLWRIFRPAPVVTTERISAKIRKMLPVIAAFYVLKVKSNPNFLRDFVAAVLSFPTLEWGLGFLVDPGGIVDVEERGHCF